MRVGSQTVLQSNEWRNSMRCVPIFLSLAMVGGFCAIPLTAQVDDVEEKKGFPSTYVPEYPEFTTRADAVENPLEVIKEITTLQTEKLQSIDCIKSRAWFHLTNKRSKKPSLILAELLFTRSPFCSRIVH